MMRHSKPEVVHYQEYGDAANSEIIGESKRYFEIDWDRCEEVLGALLDTYRAGEFPYNLEEARLPQDERHLPEGIQDDPRMHSMFLFTSCYYMRGGIRSVDAMRRLTDLWNLDKGLFDPIVAQNLDPKVIEQKLKNVGLGFQQTVSGQIVENSRRLIDLYDGDPRTMFEGVESYDQALSRIQNDKKGGGFLGFQEKMVSMISYYLVEQGLIDYYHFPLPVDVHVFRVTAATGMIRFNGYDESKVLTPDNIDQYDDLFEEVKLSDILYRTLVVNQPTEADTEFLRDHTRELNQLFEGDNVYSQEALALMRHLYSEYALKHDLSMIELCNVVWLLSQSICGQQPGNQTREPLDRRNREGRSTLLIPYVQDLGRVAQQKLYDRSCANCPLNHNDTCTANYPSKPYYVHGVLYKRGDRLEYPNPPTQLELF